MPIGRPAAASAGSSACSTIARAVPSASDPIRNTAVLPVRTTPAASANTFGRPSNTNPTTPSGARLTSTSHPTCARVSITRSRAAGASRHVRNPAIMSARIVGDSSRRVVDRPPAAARSTSRRFAAAIGWNVSSSAMRAANTSKNSVICSSAHDPSASNAASARADGCVEPARARRQGHAAGRRCRARRRGDRLAQIALPGRRGRTSRGRHRTRSVARR